MTGAVRTRCSATVQNRERMDWGVRRQCTRYAVADGRCALHGPADQRPGRDWWGRLLRAGQVRASCEWCQRRGTMAAAGLDQVVLTGADGGVDALRDPVTRWVSFGIGGGWAQVCPGCAEGHVSARV